MAAWTRIFCAVDFGDASRVAPSDAAVLASSQHA
jgi:hypothetical protein